MISVIRPHWIGAYLQTQLPQRACLYQYCTYVAGSKSRARINIVGLQLSQDINRHSLIPVPLSAAF